MSEDKDEMQSKSVRLPKSVWDGLKDLADKNYRSVNSQLIVSLKELVKADA